MMHVLYTCMWFVNYVCSVCVCVVMYVDYVCSACVCVVVFVDYVCSACVCVVMFVDYVCSACVCVDVRGHVCGLCVHYCMVYGSQIHADVKSEVANNRYFFIEHHILQIMFHHSNNFLH